RRGAAQHRHRRRQGSHPDGDGDASRRRGGSQGISRRTHPAQTVRDGVQSDRGATGLIVPRTWGVYLVTDRTQTAGRPLLDVVAAALDGGIRAVQLRERDLATRALLRVAEQLRALTRRYDAPPPRPVRGPPPSPPRVFGGPRAPAPPPPPLRRRAADQ